LLIPRKKGTSEQEFHEYWSKIHGPLVREWSVERKYFGDNRETFADGINRLVSYGCVRYNQVSIRGKMDYVRGAPIRGLLL
jgi:hypothetical protein